MRHTNNRTLLSAAHHLREQVLASLEHIDPGREQVPHLRILNPPLWELGHIGWFQEFWCLRGGNFDNPSILPGADDLYNSTDVIHTRRWSLPLIGMAATREYIADVFERACEQLERCENSDQALYFHRLSHFHEAMHLEAFLYSWQTLAYPRPSMLGSVPRLPAATDLNFGASSVQIGSRPQDGFCFDNEKWALQCEVPAFQIADRPVTNAEFLEFVLDAGYKTDSLWDPGYLERLRTQGRTLPLYWSRDGDDFFRRNFSDTTPLVADAPMLNVSAFEAEAFCRWAGRRLPTEAEWAVAAADSRCRWGGIAWEWTATTFAPLPGFSADPYKEYSEPWFHTHRVVRGGSFATPPQLTDIRFRNFYEPWRADPFFGFRTCASQT